MECSWSAKAQNQWRHNIMQPGQNGLGWSELCWSELCKLWKLSIFLAWYIGMLNSYVPAQHQTWTNILSQYVKRLSLWFFLAFSTLTIASLLVLVCPYTGANPFWVTHSSYDAWTLQKQINGHPGYELYLYNLSFPFQRARLSHSFKSSGWTAKPWHRLCSFMDTETEGKVLVCSQRRGSHTSNTNRADFWGCWGCECNQTTPTATSLTSQSSSWVITPKTKRQ